MTSMLNLEFEMFSNDLVYEILSRLPIEDIVRSRRVCKRLQEATYQRIVWSNAYRISELLIPEGPFATQTGRDLEDILVRAAKIQWKWSVPSGAQAVSRKFIEGLPAFEYDVAMISGRYVVVATRNKISWYDLDKDGKEQLDVPIAVYDMGNTGTISVGMQNLTIQTNANNEGIDVAYVAFVANRCVKVLKVRLPPTSTSIEIAIESSQLDYFPIHLVLENSFILAIKEFQSDTDLMDILHIPTKQKYLVPMHGRVHNLSDLNYVNYMISPTHLIMTFPITHEGKSEVEFFRLPVSSPASRPVSRMELTHRLVYPGVIWKAVLVFETRPPENPHSAEVRIGILASCYEEFNRRGIGGKTSVQYFDIVISPMGVVEFLMRSSSVVHDVKPQTTDIFATSNSVVCLAVTQTYTSHGQILMMHNVEPCVSTAVGNIVANRFVLPRGREGMTLTTFDGFCGRILFNVQGSEKPRVDVWSMI